MPKHCVFFSSHGGQKEYFEHGLLVALRSVRYTNPDLPVAVLYDELSPEERQALGGCELVRVDASVFGVGTRNDLTRATYFKFFVEKLERYDKALYLDSDLVVLDSLERVFEYEGPLAARNEPYDLAHEYTDPARAMLETGVPAGGPFLNGGVVLFDTAYWAREKLLEKALALGKRFGWEFFRNADQGILNILAHRAGGFTELPIVYNFCRWPEMVLAAAAHTGRNARKLKAPYILRRPQQKLASWGVPPALFGAPMAKVVHWNGPNKPWQFGEADKKSFMRNAMNNLRSEFQKNGFFILREFFLPEEMNLVLAEIKKAGGSTDNPGDESTERLNFFHNVYRRSSSLREFCSQPRIVDVIAALGEPFLWMRWDHAVEKTAGGEEYPWHQDNAYSKVKDPSFQLWIALTDCDEKTGGLWFRQGSHRRGLRPHKPYGKNHLTCEENLGKPFYFCAKAGDVAVFSSYILHRSDPNLSKNSRWVYIVEYMSKRHYDPTIKPPYFMIAEKGVSKPELVPTFRGKRSLLNQLKYYRYNPRVQAVRHSLRKTLEFASGKRGG